MKKLLISIVSMILLIYTFIINSTYAYTENSKISDENNTYRCVAYTSDGGYVVAGNTIDNRYGYIAIYNVNGNKIKEKTIENQSTYLKSVIQTKDNSYIVVGQNSNSYSDAVIIKFDSDLNMIWENKYTGSKYESYCSVIESQDGSIVAVGYTDQINGNSYSSKGLIVKYNKNGEQLWANAEGGTSHDIFNSVIETSDNCYVAVGKFKSNDIDGLNINGEADAVVYKYDVEGQIISKKAYGGNSYDEFKSIIKTTDGYITFGTTSSNDIENITDSAQWKCLIVKYDENFNLLWNKGYGSGHQSSFLSGISLPNNTIIAIGETYTISPIQHGVLIQYDQNGNIIYTQTTDINEDLGYIDIILNNNKFTILEKVDSTEKSKLLQYTLDEYNVDNNPENNNSNNIDNNHENNNSNNIDNNHENNNSNNINNNHENNNSNNIDNNHENNNSNNDVTTSKAILPKTGFINRLMIILVLFILGISILLYNKSKNIDK